MKITIGQKVKVVKCIDDDHAIETKYLNQIGTVREIHNDRPAPIGVEFDGIGRDGFWEEELELI